MKTAQTSRQYNAIDAAKFFCAILIVTIHFPPLGNAAVSPLAQAVNSFFRSYLGRIAVPFFLLSAGFFLFRKTASQPFSTAPSKAYVLRILRLYVLWTILYLPWIIREARESGKNLLTGLLSFLRNFLLTGSYSHLWYLPALAVAAALVGWLLRKGLRPGTFLPPRPCFTASGFWDRAGFSCSGPCREQPCIPFCGSMRKSSPPLETVFSLASHMSPWECILPTIPRSCQSVVPVSVS